MADKLQKSFPLVKVDVANRLVYGLVTAEYEDKDGETCHYETTKPEYQSVNQELGKASDGANIMPLREMHQLNAVGAGKSIEFDDGKKQIRMAFKVVDDSAWNKVLEKVLLGFSQGGTYLKRWTEAGKKYYTAQPGEVSLVDNPCLPGAFIEYAKADGSVEMFKTPEPDVEKIIKAATSELDTRLEKIDSRVADLVRQLSPQGDHMNPEQIKKCAAALGITEAEFQAQFLDEGKPLAKGHSMAALHAQIKKAFDHHEEMVSHHEKMGKMHAAHAAHLGKCMKAAHALMGTDDEAEKAIKAMLDELKIAPAETEEEKIAKAKAAAEKKDPITVTNTELAALIKNEVEKGVKEAVEKLPKNDASDRAQLFAVRRGEVEKAKAAQAPNDSIPV